jgi:hypothetical protein
MKLRVTIKPCKYTFKRVGKVEFKVLDPDEESEFNFKTKSETF